MTSSFDGALIPDRRHDYAESVEAAIYRWPSATRRGRAAGAGQLRVTICSAFWGPLTLFLRQPGAPLDNSIVERSLKRAILHRKNAYFYRTSNGSSVGDLFMSVIHTCELAGVNAFDYLTVLQEHEDAIRKTPTAWMPWNYQQHLSSADTAAASA
jgi:hypothetical protein